MPYQTKLKIRFGDEDHAGIVYFPRFLDFFHCAFEDFFDDHGIPYREVLDDDRIGWPTVHVSCDFYSPIRFGDVLVVDLWVERIGEKSTTFRYRGRCEGRPGDVAVCSIVHACIDMDAFASKPIPDRYIALFERYREPPDDYAPARPPPE